MPNRMTRYARLVVPAALALALLAPVGLAVAAEPYRSPMREQCEGELAKDKGWQAELRQSVRPDVHQEDANITMRNKKHVVMAYGALWGLSVIFLVLMWLRQRRLVAEMDRLAQQIAKAAAE
ncbi:MAG TPA: hypothetical protein VK698_00785 [Kofleriaceae bacterium]|nr:hypothetical protein [Kofleriaceae bacterium]